MITKISSMLDDIADRLEKKGLTSEAYEIDKVADVLDCKRTAGSWTDEDEIPNEVYSCYNWLEQNVESIDKVAPQVNKKVKKVKTLIERKMGQYSREQQKIMRKFLLLIQDIKNIADMGGAKGLIGGKNTRHLLKEIYDRYSEIMKEFNVLFD